MRTGTLTDLSVRSLSARDGKRTEIWDAKLPGFGVRVSPTGTKTFVLMYYLDGRKQRLTLGRFPFMTLADARGKAMTALGQAKQGIDPAQPARSEAAKLAFETVVEDFIEKHCLRHNRKSTSYETSRLLRSRFCPAWRGRDIRDIKRAEVLAILDKAVRSKRPSAANHALSAVRKLFAWCVERGLIEHNPCLGVSRPAPTASRERVLSDQELGAIWRAADEIGFPMGPITQLLMLTAQRRGEVAGMRWSEIDFNTATWSIPAQRTKNKRVHVLPLTPGVIAIVSNLPRINDDLVFPARGSDTEAVSGFSKMKPKLAALTEVTNWTLHDLRRTAATTIARLGIAPHVVERILNHSTGTFGGVAGVYNRFQYLPEMRSALEQWNSHIIGLIPAAP